MASTPPPLLPHHMGIPPTPLHGAREEHPRDHLFIPRRSARIQHTDTSPNASSVSRSRTTPSPGSSRIGLRHSPRFLTVENTSITTTSRNTSRNQEFAGLPTPSKTPAKKKQNPATPSTARVLFPTSSRSRASGLTIAGEDPGAIEIYEDFRERLPKVVEGEDNPFLASSSSHGRKKRKTTAVEPPLDKDGMWYTFRGKKVYKKFEGKHRDIQPRFLFNKQENNPEIDAEDEETDVPSSPIHGPENDVVHIELLTSAQQAEKDKIGTISEPSIDLVRETVEKVRDMTPDLVETAISFGGPFTPPTTTRRKRTRPVAFAEDEAGPSTPQRQQVKARKLHFGEDHNHGLHTPAKTPANRNKRLAVPETPDEDDFDTTRSTRRSLRV